MKKNLIKTLAIALIGFSVFTVTKVDVKAITQDEMIQMMIDHGADIESLTGTGGVHPELYVGDDYFKDEKKDEAPSTSATTPAEQPKTEVKPKESKVEKEKACNHEYEEVVTTKPTCTKDGVKTFTCNICGDTYTTPMQALGHTESEWEVTKEPTCTEKGMKEQKCSVCGEVLNTEELDMIEHTASDWEIKAKATLTHTGTEVQKCIVCSTVLGEREIPINMTTWYIIIGAAIVGISIITLIIVLIRHKNKALIRKHN